MGKIVVIAVVAAATLLLAACAAVPTVRERQGYADGLAEAKGWQILRLPAGGFDLVAYLPRAVTPAATLTVYLEGDGFSWVSSSTPSRDPTPRDPLALKLALAHPGGNAAYLARPCQYVDAEAAACPQRYWTDRRFAPETVDSTGLAIDSLKQRFGARELVLVGYSGGGNIAALLAARRTDVVGLVTVAGNLDHPAWTAHHRVQSLEGSLNAADVAEPLAAMPQVHFVGGRDRIIPPELASRWPPPLRGVDGRNLRVIKDFGHGCCWADDWPAMIGSFRPLR